MCCSACSIAKTPLSLVNSFDFVDLMKLEKKRQETEKILNPVN
jgi:hypothetical protein